MRREWTEWKSAHQDMRVGEAKKPGPSSGGRENVFEDEGDLGHSLDSPGYRLPFSRELARTSVVYPKPGGNPGFSRTCTPGLECDSGNGHKLSVMTVNTTGWARLKKVLRATEECVVLAQEHRVWQGQVAEKSAWARRHGWKSIWTAAIAGEHGGASGGTAIFVRE